MMEQNNQVAVNAQDTQDKRQGLQDQFKEHSGVNHPKQDTRYKTEDVMDTIGLSFMDFNLSKDVNLGIYEMGYDHPSPVQEEAIPYIIDGKNVIAKAKNGTGKTGSYAIPIVEKIDLNNDKI